MRFTSSDVTPGSLWTIAGRRWTVAEVRVDGDWFVATLADPRSALQGRARLRRADTRPYLGSPKTAAVVEGELDGWEGYRPADLHVGARARIAMFAFLVSSVVVDGDVADTALVDGSHELASLRARADEALRSGDLTAAARLLYGDVPAVERELLAQESSVYLHLPWSVVAEL